MTKLQTVQQISREIIEALYKNKEEYAKFLRFAANIYKLSTSSAMQLYLANPDAKLFATYDGWINNGRYVLRGEKGSAIVTPDQQLQTYFADTQTDGKEIKLWSITKENKEELVKQLNRDMGTEAKTVSQCLDIIVENSANKILPRIEANLDIPIRDKLSFEKSYKSMILSEVIERCTFESRFKYKGQAEYRPDMYAIDMCKNSDEFLCLADGVGAAAKNAILSIANKIEQIQKQQELQRSDENERNQNENRERSNNVSVRGGREVVSRNHDGNAGFGESGVSDGLQARSQNVDVSASAEIGGQRGGRTTSPAADRVLWKEVAGIHDGELSGTSAGIGTQLEMVDNPSIDRQGSRGNEGDAGSKLQEAEPDAGNVLGESGVYQDNAAGEFQHNNEGIGSSGEVIKREAGEITPASYKFETQDFAIADENIGIGGPKEKYAANIAALKVLKRCEREGRAATHTEQTVLSGYVGWGGLANAFDDTKSDWSSEYAELKQLLTSEEYESAKASSLSAFYTSPTIIDEMYSALQRFGFTGGNILEPSMGIGNFFGRMPEEIKNSSNLYGVELDDVSGRIAKLLYPSADISITGFERKNFEDGYFDVAIGNVPFGDFGVNDKRYNSRGFLIHDYFFAKTLDKLAPGGVAAFITSKGTMDKQSTAVREYISERAELIGAIRLPNTAFKENAGTNATTDIIFLQKRTKPTVEKPNWIYTVRNDDGIVLNQYYDEHPEMILGQMKTISSRFGMTTACVPNENADLKTQLHEAVKNLQAQFAVKKAEMQEKRQNGEIPATADVRNFTHTIVEDKIYFRENEKMLEISVTERDKARIKGLCEVRAELRKLINAQVSDCDDAELKVLQSNLTKAYDKFVEKNGYISDKANVKVFAQDDDINLLVSLEKVDAVTKQVTKAEIFDQRTIRRSVDVNHADNPAEALYISMDIKGGLDIPYIAELTDLSTENVVEQLSSAGLIYLNPEKISKYGNVYDAYEEASEYLSGNVREKLDMMNWAELRYSAEPEILKRLEGNRAALKNVMPQTIEAASINVSIGVNWVDTQDYGEFIAEYSKLPSFISCSCPIHRTRSGEYKIENKSNCKHSMSAVSTYGTSRMNSLEILENLLNKREIVVRDRKETDGVERYVINPKQTQLAAEKARQMSEGFQKWLFATPERREKYVERYNRLFNSIVGRQYDGSRQTFPGMSPDIQLREHQKNAVARAKLGGNTLLAHVVGAGKSFEMAAATMEKKRLVTITKACVVVPKHLVGQTALEWQRLYPNAHLLTASEKDFSKDNRQRFMGRCLTGNYDAVIMSYEQFEKIPMSQEYRLNFLREELNEIIDQLSELRSSSRSNFSVKDLEGERKKLEKKITQLMDGGKTKDTAINFEQLGFDYLVVDEAHAYKNGLVVTKMNNVSGVSSRPAQKSEDILMKCRYMNEKTDYSGILFATGTPVSNSMSEFYTMQRYLRPDLLAKAGLQTFDDWASNFGEVVSQLELKPAGDGYRTKRRFAKFNNLPELMRMYKEFADIKTAENLKLPVPDMIGGKPITIVAKPDEFQTAYIQELAERSERVHSGAVDSTVDNMLKITHEARLLGLDARAINPTAPENPNGKVNMCVENVMRIYENTSEQKGVQVVFCDIAVNGDEKAGKWSVYDHLKQEFIRRGIPETEICFAGDAKSQAERNEMYTQLRSGTKRIVIASTSKMGTGANIQKKLAALHHLDIPWKPSDLEQRNGRILRQGNEFKEVGVYHYVTEKTFDAYMLNIITTKQKFISQVMTDKAPARTCSDVDDMVLNYSEMQAIASGDPRIKEKIELDGEVARLRTLESEHYKQIYKIQDETIPGYKSDLAVDEKLLLNAKEDLETRNKTTLTDKFPGIEIDGFFYDDRKEAGTALRPFIEKIYNGKGDMSLEVGSYCGFKLTAEQSSFSANSVKLVLKGKLNYTTETELASDIGNVMRIENVFKSGIEKRVKLYESRIEETKRNLEEAEEAITKPFPHAEELRHNSVRLEELNAVLNADTPDSESIGEEEQIGSEEKTMQEERKNKLHM